MGAIEEVILRHDGRGINRVARYLPEAYCLDAARFALDHPGRVLIATGFFVLHAGNSDTDGAMGAVVLAHALRALGNDVRYVTDGPNVEVLRGMEDGSTEVVDFPWGERDASRAVARRLLNDLRPALLLAVERPGFAQGERYLNYRGMDITLAMSKLDFLFEGFPTSIGIGDGGNEIGMGGLARELVLEEVTPYPALTKTAKTIVASTSLWGVYGLVTALSLLTDRDLLPTAQMQEHLLRKCVELNAADATTGRREVTVDSHSLAECASVLEDLRKTVGAGMASSTQSSRR